MARLPVVGGDQSTWGTVLNGDISVGHNADGTHRPYYLASENGLIGDNSTDNLSAWNALMTVMATNGGVVLLDTPNGIYRHSGTLNIANNNIRIQGLGRGRDGAQGLTTFKPTFATGDVFNVTGDGTELDDFCIQASVTRTSGYDVDVPSNVNITLQRIQSLAPYNGFKFNANFYRCIDCVMYNAVNDMVLVDDPNASGIIRGFFGAGLAASPSVTGLRVTRCGSLRVSDCDWTNAVNCCDLNPTAGSFVSSVFVTNTYFDCISASGTQGLVIQGSGNIQDCSFHQCWISAHSSGATINNTATTGTEHILSFSQCQFQFNKNNGCNVQEFHATLAFNECFFNANNTVGPNGSGLVINGNATANRVDRWTLKGGSISQNTGTGATGLFIGNAAATYGLVDDVVIHGNTANQGGLTVTGNGITIGRVIN